MVVWVHRRLFIARNRRSPTPAIFLFKIWPKKHYHQTHNKSFCLQCALCYQPVDWAVRCTSVVSVDISVSVIESNQVPNYSQDSTSQFLIYLSVYCRYTTEWIDQDQHKACFTSLVIVCVSYLSVKSAGFNKHALHIPFYTLDRHCHYGCRSHLLWIAVEA